MLIVESLLRRFREVSLKANHDDLYISDMNIWSRNWDRTYSRASRIANETCDSSSYIGFQGSDAVKEGSREVCAPMVPARANVNAGEFLSAPRIFLLSS